MALPQAGRAGDHASRPGRPADRVRELPPQLPRVVSVGRLDLNSEGLLLLTNDGELARRLELPATGWVRRYRVRVHGRPDERALAGLARGVTVEGVRYGPIEAGLDAVKGDNAWLTVALREGRNREVRRVMTHLSLPVTRLIRVAYGPFQLGTLPRGAVEEVPARVLRDQLPRRRPEMRIVAAPGVGGRWPHRRAPAPGPTADRVRQALFDMLLHAPGADAKPSKAPKCWMLFAGTGALGVGSTVARRRTAQRSWSGTVPPWPPCAPISPGSGATSAAACWPRCAASAARARPCGLVFLDPPYGAELVPRAVARLRAAGWIGQAPCW